MSATSRTLTLEEQEAIRSLVTDIHQAQVAVPTAGDPITVPMSWSQSTRIMELAQALIFGKTLHPYTPKSPPRRPTPSLTPLWNRDWLLLPPSRAVLQLKGRPEVDEATQTVRGVPKAALEARRVPKHVLDAEARLRPAWCPNCGEATLQVDDGLKPPLLVCSDSRCGWCNAPETPR